MSDMLGEVTDKVEEFFGDGDSGGSARRSHRRRGLQYDEEDEEGSGTFAIL